jgi:hypothetical protein
VADPRERPDPPRASDGSHEPHEAQLDAAVRGAYRTAHPDETAAQSRLLERLRRRRASGLRWWLDAQWFELRPVAAVGLAALTLAAGVWGGMLLAGRAGRQAAAVHGAAPAGDARAAAASAGIPVTFVLRAPGATSVCVAGDFNSWDAAATPMAHAGSGDLWIVRVELPRGVHLYSFVLDGREWRPDPSAPLAAGDAFGGRNSVVVVNGAQPL